MNNKIVKEIFLILLCAAPFVYLANIYHDLPDIVPTHFNIKGKPNGWSRKATLWLIPACLPIFCYLIFTVIPIIDPKQRLKTGAGIMGKLKFIFVLFIVAISCFCLRLNSGQFIKGSEQWLTALLGIFFVVIGNFMPAMKPNYFVGIRTPWTLENESVWRGTHQWGGRLWILCGIIFALCPFLFPAKKFVDTLMLFVVLFMALAPMVYSYFLWRKIKNQNLQ